MKRPLIALAAAIVFATPAHASDVAMNEVQVIGTHNSYKRETTPAEQAKYDELIRTPGDYAQYLAYSHPTITNQLKRQHVRGLELDLWPDPQGGLYANPFVRQALGLGPLPNAEWTQARHEAPPRRRPRLQHDRELHPLRQLPRADQGLVGRRTRATCRS